MSDDMPVPCFCGRHPIFGTSKKTSCQMHGEPSQAITMHCRPDCFAKPFVQAGDIYNGGKEQAKKKAIAAWNKGMEPYTLAAAMVTVDDVAMLKTVLLENQKVLIILRDACTHDPTRKLLADLMDANTRVLNLAKDRPAATTPAKDLEMVMAEFKRLQDQFDTIHEIAAKAPNGLDGFTQEEAQKMHHAICEIYAYSEAGQEIAYEALRILSAGVK